MKPISTAPISPFNGAGVFRPRKFHQSVEIRRNRVALQWGRGLSTPEIGSTDTLRGGVNRPSMGPGSFDPGNSQEAFQALLWAFLQWGRGLSTPEILWLHLVMLFIGNLQWGRGLSTPEMRTHSGKDCHSIHLQWGRGLSTPEIFGNCSLATLALPLQWGRGLSTPEIWGLPTA